MQSQWLHTCSQQKLVQLLVKQLCDTQAFRVQHSSIRPIAQTSSKQDKDRHHRCSKFVNSFSGPVKLLQTKMFKRNYKISISIPQAGTVLCFQSFFSRLVKRHLELSDPCQSIKLIGKVLLSLSL